MNSSAQISKDICFRTCIFFPLILFCFLLQFTITSAEGQVIAQDTLTSPLVKTGNLWLEKGEPKTKSPTGAMIRSALFPGWGQYYTEQYVKSGLILCVESGLILSAIVQDKKARDVYQTDYDEYLRRLDRRNGYLWWTAGVIVFSMIDAYVDAHLFGFDENQYALGLKPSFQNSGFNIVLFIDL
jgi:hypothetical protein